MFTVRIDDLNRDAESGSGLSDTAGDDIVGVELFPDDSDAVVRGAKRKCRISTDDGQPSVLGQGGNDVFRDAVGEIVFIRIAIP